jgi:hypothetical protein
MAEVIHWAQSEPEALSIAGEAARPLLLDFFKER